MENPRRRHKAGSLTFNQRVDGSIPSGLTTLFSIGKFGFSGLRKEGCKIVICDVICDVGRRSDRGARQTSTCNGCERRRVAGGS